MKEENQIRKVAEVYGYMEEKDYRIMRQVSGKDYVFRVCCKKMQTA